MGRSILLRFDDICPTMNYEQFGRAMELLRKIDAKPLLGVIPDCHDPDLQIEAPHEDFWLYMQQLQKRGYTLAMHGYQHVFDTDCRGTVSMGRKSEFAGHSLEGQTKKIKLGKEILFEHGINTDIFFAPAHSYDDNTLKALSMNGFRYISDGMSAKPYKKHGIICLPCRSGGVPRIKNTGYYTAVLHAHEWVRPDKARGYDSLKWLCDNFKGDITDFSTYANRSCGNLGLQIINEKAVVGWKRYLRPVAAKIKKSIIG